MFKAKLLKSAPKIKEVSINSSDEITIKQINRALKALSLEYKRVDEIDIYNIFRFIKESSKG